eukprot:Skav227556  [mRNA]  locus=scaffold3241:127705:128883:+ [translate_table: standard]
MAHGTGGIAEIFLMRPDLEQVYIKSRKGFVRMALQAGVDIVPVYGLGHTQLFSMLDKSSGLGNFLMKISRKYKAWGNRIDAETSNMYRCTHQDAPTPSVQLVTWLGETRAAFMA